MRRERREQIKKIAIQFVGVVIINSLLSILLLSCKGPAISLFGGKKSDKKALQQIDKYPTQDWTEKIKTIQELSKHLKGNLRKKTIKLYIEALDDPHSTVRMAALKYLKGINSPEIMDIAKKLALKDRSPNVRWQAYELLSSMGNLKEKKVLLAGTKDSDWLVREVALKALLKTSTAQEQKELMPIIIKAMNSPRTSTKNTAIKNLKIRNKIIVQQLKKIILSPKSRTSSLRNSIAKLNGSRFDGETENALRKLIFHRDERVRILSLRALKKNKELKESKEEN